MYSSGRMHNSYLIQLMHCINPTWFQAIRYSLPPLPIISSNIIITILRNIRQRDLPKTLYPRGFWLYFYLCLFLLLLLLFLLILILLLLLCILYLNINRNIILVWVLSLSTNIIIILLLFFNNFARISHIVHTIIIILLLFILFLLNMNLAFPNNRLTNSI